MPAEAVADDPTTGEIVASQSALVEAVCAVMGEVGYVRGTGRNTQQGYGYTSDADLLSALQPLMAKHGLMISPTTFEMHEIEWKTPKGGNGLLTRVFVTYTLRHISGEAVSVKAPGSGWNNMDKGIYSAMTGAYKYALRQLFAIPTGDDAERDQPRQRQQEAPPPPGNPEDRDRLRKAWHATLGRLASQSLTPKLDDIERHLVQKHCWGVESISDLTDADCGVQLSNINNTDDGTLASLIRHLIGADG
jgi:hypothetical protein